MEFFGNHRVSTNEMGFDRLIGGGKRKLGCDQEIIKSRALSTLIGALENSLRTSGVTSGHAAEIAATVLGSWIALTLHETKSLDGNGGENRRASPQIPPALGNSFSSLVTIVRCDTVSLYRHKSNA